MNSCAAEDSIFTITRQWATELRSGSRIYSAFIAVRLRENAAVKQLSKLVNIWLNYWQNKNGAILMTTIVHWD